MGTDKGKDKKNYAQADILKLPYLVLVFSMLFTIGSTYIFYKNEESKDLVRFQGETDRCKNRIENKLRAYVSLLKAGRGFIESNHQINKNSFSSFVNSLEIEKNYPEITQIGFSKTVRGNERAALIKKMAGEKVSGFNIYPLSDNRILQPVIYIEPADNQNLSLIGFDLLSNPVYQTAINQSTATGEITTTEKIPLDASAKKTGFMILMPVYKDGAMPQTDEEKESLLEGFVFDLIDTNGFLKDVHKNAGALDILISVYENQSDPQNLLAQTENNSQQSERALLMTSEANIAGKKLLVHYQTLSAFDEQSGASWTPIIFIVGTIVSLLLFGTTFLESYARAKAEKITDDLRESEREKGFLLEREQRARHLAEDSSQAKDEFISIVSHELRTPLNSIAGWSRILQTDNLSETTRKKALQTIDKNVRLQTAIVENLLDLSQMLSGSQCLEKHEFSISGLFEQVFSEFEPLAKDKKITLVKENSINGQVLFGDDEKLKQALKNLLSNSIKFTPEGGQIITKLRERDKSVEIKISDTGQGIKAEALSTIFDNFRQADSSITRIHGGLGVGLAITRRIIELHGGQISASSEGEWKGTTFTINIPFPERNHLNEK